LTLQYQVHNNYLDTIIDGKYINPLNILSMMCLAISAPSLNETSIPCPQECDILYTYRATFIILECLSTHKE